MTSLDWIVFDFYGVIVDGSGNQDQGIIELIGFLSHKYKLAIASNSYFDFIKTALDDFSLTDQISKIISSSELNTIKPDPEFWRQAEESLQANASQILLIDDRQENVESAQSVGWQGIVYHGISSLTKELTSFGIKSSYA